MPLRFWNRAGGLLATRPQAIIAAVREMAEVTAEVTAMTARYAALAVPVGMLFPKGDKVLDAGLQGADFCAVAPAAELTVVDGGHMLPVTQPKAVRGFHPQATGPPGLRETPDEEILAFGCASARALARFRRWLSN